MSSLLNVPLLASGTTSITASENAKPDRLHKAAQDFESLLIGQMLKSVHESNSDGWLGGGEDTGEDSAMDMAESQLANSLASSGGLGLAKTIEHSMARNSAQKTADTAPASLVKSSAMKE